MPGRQGLPAGEPRKASQRRSRRAGQSETQMAIAWTSGDIVHWRERTGKFHRHVGDGEHAEIVIADRTYRVRVADLV